MSVKTGFALLSATAGLAFFGRFGLGMTRSGYSRAECADRLRPVEPLAKALP
jgi:hypothetical protein